MLDMVLESAAGKMYQDFICLTYYMMIGGRKERPLKYSEMKKKNVRNNNKILAFTTLKC